MTAKQQKSVIGEVTRISGLNTVKVTMQGSVVHPKYKKRYSVTRSLLADTNGIEVAIGDQVVLHETKPVSRHKAWAVQKVAEKRQK